jgi:hypothetical protein
MILSPVNSDPAATTFGYRGSWSLRGVIECDRDFYVLPNTAVLIAALSERCNGAAGTSSYTNRA